MASRSVLLARVLVSVTAIVGLGAHAATECEQNYTSKPAANGGTFYQSYVGLYGTDAAKAMASLKATAEKNHFQPVGDSSVSPSGIITTVVAQKTSTKAHGFPIVLVVAPQTDSAVIAFQLVKGASTDAKGNICSFFDAAGLKGEATNASHLKAEQNAGLAFPLVAALNGDKSVEQAMKDSTALMETAATSTQAIMTQVKPAGAGGQASDATDPNDRGAAPKIADNRKVISPKSAFNPADVNASLLSEGTSTISGFTCGSISTPGGAQFQAAANQAIVLFPYSTYLKESIDLIDANRHKGDKVRLDIDKRAFETRLDGKTNANGDFQFSRVKPGHYIVMTLFQGSTTTTRNTPQSSYQASTNTVYEWTSQEQIVSSSTDVLQADVTVKSEGQVVDGVVVKASGNGRFLPVLSGVCKWHHSS